MKCPVCSGVELKMADRQGIEIDYCPQCRGVWLDRGELDKIIERTVVPQAPAAGPGQARGDAAIRNHHHRDVDGRYNDKRHRKRSSLFDLFDFD